MSLIGRFSAPLRAIPDSPRVNDSSTQSDVLSYPKMPRSAVSMTNRFVVQLSGEDMWWDDDPKATGFGRP